MTTFAQKRRQRVIAESEQLRIYIESRRLDLDGDMSDYFLDKVNNKFMKFDETGRAVPVSEFEFARLMKHLKKLR